MQHPIVNEVLGGEDLIVLDGGARGGPTKLAGLRDYCRVHCFEPNPSELHQVNWDIVERISSNVGERISAYPFALCGHSGKTILNISLRPGASSTLMPNDDVLIRFAPDNFSEMREIVDRIEVPAVSLSDFMEQARISAFDYIKLDTQGNELDILKSAGPRLDNVSVVVTEVEFIELYRGQALFHDVSSYLTSHGFELVDISSSPTCRRFHSRGNLPPSAYRLVWGDAVFARRSDDVTRPRMLQQALVLAGLGYADLAIDIFDRHPSLDARKRSELEAFARWAAEPKAMPGRVRRILERAFGVLMQRYDWRAGHQVQSRKKNRS